MTVKVTKHCLLLQLNYRTKKKIQENEFKEEFKDPSNRVSSLITNDVLEVQ